VQTRTIGKKCRLYTLRAIISLFVTILLGGAVYAIIITVEVSTDPVSSFVFYGLKLCKCICEYLSLWDQSFASSKYHSDCVHLSVANS